MWNSDCSAIAVIVLVLARYTQKQFHIAGVFFFYQIVDAIVADVVVQYLPKDPLLIFKLESAKLFDDMVNDMNNRISSILTRGQIPEMEQQEVREAAPEQRSQRYNEQRGNELVDP